MYKRQRGFTLVEIIIVLSMLGVIMMAVMSLYIPAVRSTSVQTEVSDVQANLRLAINRMTKDLVLAGFLVSSGAAVELSGGPPANTITIRSRTVGNAFARVLAYDSTGKIGVSDADMALAFPPGTLIRLFEPLSSEEVGGVSVVYTVTDNTSTATIDSVVYPVLVVNPIPPAVPNEAVVLKVKDNTIPPMQTIIYQVDGDGNLQRIVNGTTQRLARNVESVEFASPVAKRVDITLTGQPVGLSGGGAESAAKERQLITSVALRNVY